LHAAVADAILVVRSDAAHRIDGAGHPFEIRDAEIDGRDGVRSVASQALDT
jgi:hypothetical protein